MKNNSKDEFWFKPIGSGILAEVVFEDTTRKDGLIILSEEKPEKTPTLRANVVAVGEDVKYVCIGDVVQHNMQQMHRLEYKDVLYIVIPESSVMGVWKDTHV